MEPGVRQIHTLCIIGKVAAKFNTILKDLIGKKTRDNFDNSMPCNKQHSFCPNCYSIDAALLKVLTFDCSHLQKCTEGSIQHDMTAHIDRMYPAMTSIYASRYGVDKSVMLCINKTIAALERQIESSLGLFETSYGKPEGQPLLGEMVQGKADVPQWLMQQSDAMLRAQS
jgi:hypothetical protein